MPEDENYFSVMTFNLRFALADDGENCWGKRAGIVSDVLARYPFDFLGAQEVNHVQARFLENRLCAYRHVGWHNQNCDWWQSNMIFYKDSWKCLVHEHWFLSETPDRESTMTGAKWPRQCVIGQFEKQGQQLIVVNTHFDFDETVQVKSAGIILGLLERFPPDIPVVITGDFNAEPETSAWRRFLKSGFDEAFRGSYAATFHGFGETDAGRHIDWILFRGGVHRDERRILRDHAGERYPSDHYPVWARFSFNHRTGTISSQ